MATLSHVMNAVKSSVKKVLEDAQVAAPYVVMFGWPARTQLLDFMAKGKTVITVFPDRTKGKSLSPYSTVPFLAGDGSCPVRDLMITSGDIVDARMIMKRIAVDPSPAEKTTSSCSFVLSSADGTLVAGETAAVKFKRYEVLTVDVVAAHKVVAGETCFDVLLDIASQINANGGIVPGISAVVVDGSPAASATITITLTYSPINQRRSEDVEMIVGAFAQYLIETKRQQRYMNVDIWAPSVAKREQFGDLLDDYFGVFLTEVELNSGSSDNMFNRLPLADGTAATIFYSGTWLSDEEQAQSVWRRHFDLQVEYATTARVNATAIISPLGQLEVEFPPGASVKFGGGTCFRGEGPIQSGYSGCINPSIGELLAALTVFARGC